MHQHMCLPKSSNVSSTGSSKVSNRQPTIGACIFNIEFLSKTCLLISTLKMYLILSLSYSVQTRISFKIYHGTDTYRHFFLGGGVCLWVIKKDVCNTCLDICNTCLDILSAFMHTSNMPHADAVAQYIRYTQKEPAFTSSARGKTRRQEILKQKKNVMISFPPRNSCRAELAFPLSMSAGNRVD